MSRPKALPSRRDLSDLVRCVRSDIDEDDRADDDPEDDTPAIRLTVGWTPDTGEWDYQTGDNSFTGGAYLHPVWAVYTVTRDTRLRDAARYIRAELTGALY